MTFDQRRSCVPGYGGSYEPGKWVAFACGPAELPSEWDADGVTCAPFYEARRIEIDGGSTPQAAYDDLVRLMRERRGQDRT